MSGAFELLMDHREKLGTAASRRLRRIEGKVPVILYGNGQPSIPLSIDHTLLSRLTENDSFYSAILTIQVGDQRYQAILKSLQRDPVKPKILEAEFLRIDQNKPIQLSVPLYFMGAEVAPGVKQGGGVVSYQLNSLQIRCLPSNIPENITVDIAQLGVNEPFKVSQIPLPDGVVLAEDGNQVVVTIIAKRTQSGAAA